MIITAKNGKSDKIHIYLDGEYKITTNAAFWNQCEYCNGDNIDDDDFLNLCKKINYENIMRKCYQYLASREHSAKQMRDKLYTRGYDREIVDEVILECIDRGIIDDERFSKAYIEHLYVDKHFPVRRIRQELYAAGVENNIIDTTLEAFDLNDVESLIQIINNKYINTLDFENKDMLKKVISSLQRRGFNYSDIQAALTQIKDEN